MALDRGGWSIMFIVLTIFGNKSISYFLSQFWIKIWWMGPVFYIGALYMALARMLRLAKFRLILPACCQNCYIFRKTLREAHPPTQCYTSQAWHCHSMCVSAASQEGKILGRSSQDCSYTYLLSWSCVLVSRPRANCSLSTNEFFTKGLALVVTECFKNQLLPFPLSHASTIIVIIYTLDITDFLGNCIFINIYYSPILRILRGEVQRRKRWVGFWNVSDFGRVLADCPCPNFYIITITSLLNAIDRKAKEPPPRSFFTKKGTR